MTVVSPVPSRDGGSSSEGSPTNVEVYIRIIPTVSKAGNDSSDRCCVRISESADDNSEGGVPSTSSTSVRRSVLQVWSSPLLQSNSKEDDGVGSSHAPELESTFDRVWDNSCTTEQVYQDTMTNQHRNVPQHLCNGINCTIISYGDYSSLSMDNEKATHHTLWGRSRHDDAITQGDNLDDGIVYRLVRKVFDHLRQATTSGTEITIRCSVVEVYYERLRDLLYEPKQSDDTTGDNNNNGDGGGDNTVKRQKHRGNHVQLSQAATSSGGGNIFLGASRLSCVSPEDVQQVIRRAVAIRTCSSANPDVDSPRSTLVVQLLLEQYDPITHQGTQSRLLVVDLPPSHSETAGGVLQLSSQRRPGKVAMSAIDVVQQQVRQCVEAQQQRNGMSIVPNYVPPPNSPVLCRLLCPLAFGGSSYTSVYVHVNPEVSNKTQTLETIQFGTACRQIINCPAQNVYNNGRWEDLLQQQQQQQLRSNCYKSLCHALAEECQRLRTKTTHHLYDRQLWHFIDEINNHHRNQHKSNPKPAASSNLHFTVETKEEREVRRDLMKLRSALRRTETERDEALSKASQLQSDLSILSNEHEELRNAFRTNQAEADVAFQENRRLQFENQQLKQQLRTSLFRESEAVVFLRQYRKFYMRLRKQQLQHHQQSAAAQGSGDVHSIVQSIPGAPDLNQMVDLDRIMVESGLLEANEVGIDVQVKQYSPSREALHRSTDLASKLHDEVTDNRKLSPKPSVGFLGAQLSIVERSEDGETTEARQKLFQTPSGRYIEMREQYLEQELLEACQKCSLLEEQLAAATRTASPSNGGSSGSAQDIEELKRALARRDKDLTAVIWKMNELHLTGTIFRDKVESREPHITYLEQTLAKLESDSARLLMERENCESRYKQELDRLRRKAESLAPSTWHVLGDAGEVPKLEARLVIPFSFGVDQYTPSTRRHSLGEDAGDEESLFDVFTRCRSATCVDAEAQTDTDDLVVPAGPLDRGVSRVLSHLAPEDFLFMDEDDFVAGVAVASQPQHVHVASADSYSRDHEVSASTHTPLASTPSVPAAEERQTIASLSRSAAPRIPTASSHSMHHTNNHSESTPPNLYSTESARSNDIPVLQAPEGSIDRAMKPTESHSASALSSLTDHSTSSFATHYSRAYQDSVGRNTGLSAYFGKQRKQSTATEPEDDEKSSTPEFMKVFKKIGFKKNEEVIETQGAAAVRELTRTAYGENAIRTEKASIDMAAFASTSNKKWVPKKKKKTSADSDSDDSFARKFLGSQAPDSDDEEDDDDGDDSSGERDNASMVEKGTDSTAAPSANTASATETNTVTFSAYSKPNEGSAFPSARTSSLMPTMSTGEGDSDSDDSQDDDRPKTPPWKKKGAAPPPIPKVPGTFSSSTLPATDRKEMVAEDSEDSSDDEKPPTPPWKKKGAAPPPLPTGAAALPSSGLSITVKKPVAESDSDESDDEEKPKTPPWKKKDAAPPPPPDALGSPWKKASASPSTAWRSGSTASPSSPLWKGGAVNQPGTRPGTAASAQSSRTTEESDSEDEASTGQKPTTASPGHDDGSDSDDETPRNAAVALSASQSRGLPLARKPATPDSDSDESDDETPATCQPRSVSVASSAASTSKAVGNDRVARTHNDSDEASSDDEESSTRPAANPPKPSPTVADSSKNGSSIDNKVSVVDSDDSSDDEGGTKQSVPLQSTAKSFSLSRTADQCDSSEDEESSDEDEPKRPPVVAPSATKAAVPAAADSDSSDEELVPRRPAPIAAAKHPVPITAAKPPAAVTRQRDDDDSSEGDEDQEEESARKTPMSKAAGRIPVPSTQSAAADPVKSTVPKSSSTTGTDDSSDNESGGDEQVCLKSTIQSKQESESESSDDDEAAPPATASQPNQLGASVLPAVPKPTSMAPAVRAPAQRDSTESEESEYSSEEENPPRPMAVKGRVVATGTPVAAPTPTATSNRHTPDSPESEASEHSSEEEDSPPPRAAAKLALPGTTSKLSTGETGSDDESRQTVKVGHNSSTTTQTPESEDILERIRNKILQSAATGNKPAVTDPPTSSSTSKSPALLRRESDGSASDDSGSSSEDDNDDHGFQTVGKPAGFVPTRKVPDYGAQVTPSVTQAANHMGGWSDSKKEKAKFVIRNGRLVKSDSSVISEESGASSVTIKSPKKKKPSSSSISTPSPSKKAAKFVIRDGKLVKDDSAIVSGLSLLSSLPQGQMVRRNSLDSKTGDVLEKEDRKGRRAELTLKMEPSSPRKKSNNAKVGGESGKALFVIKDGKLVKSPSASSMSAGSGPSATASTPSKPAFRIVNGKLVKNESSIDTTAAPASSTSKRSSSKSRKSSSTGKSSASSSDKKDRKEKKSSSKKSPKKKKEKS